MVVGISCSPVDSDRQLRIDLLVESLRGLAAALKLLPPQSEGLTREADPVTLARPGSDGVSVELAVAPSEPTQQLELQQPPPVDGMVSALSTAYHAALQRNYQSLLQVGFCPVLDGVVDMSALLV